MKVLSIEVSTDFTRVLEIDYKVKNPKIYHSFSFETPMGVVGDGVVKKNEDFKKLLQKMLLSQKIKTRKAVFTVISGKIASREVEIPYVKENRIKELLNANSAEYFPVDLTQYQLVYRLIPSPELEKERKRKLFVLAVPNTLVEAYEEFSSYCMLELTGMEYTGNSVFQTMVRAVRDGRSVSVKIDEESAMISIINHGQLELQRTIFYGIAEAEALVQDSRFYKESTYQNIHDYLENECLLLPQFDKRTQEADPERAELKADVTESLRPLVGNIGRVLSYYTSNHAGAEFKDMAVLGNAATTAGLCELLKNELGLDVFLLTAERSKLSGISKGFPIEKYVVCYGAMLAPMEFSLGEKQEAEALRAKKKREMFAAKVFLGACVVCSLGMAAYSITQHFVLKAGIRSLNHQKDELVYIQDIYDAYVKAQAEYTDVMSMGDKTITLSDQLADVIVEMEQKLPQNVTVSSLSSDETGLTLDMKATSKPEAAKVIEQLRSFEAFQDVTTSGIAEMVDESGVVTVQFTVTCYYAGGAPADGEGNTETSAEEDVETYMSGDAEKTNNLNPENTEKTGEDSQNE